jgi:hypothetical protein
VLRDELRAADPELHAALERSWHIAANEWLPAVAHRAGTFNSYPHLRNLENHLARLHRAFRDYHAPNVGPLLSPIEIYVLLMSVLLHDIGKTSGKEPHSEEAYRIINSEYLQLGIPHRYLASIIARICRCHGVAPSKLASEINRLTTISVDPYGEVREHCCATLLILVDHMDATFRRVAPAYTIESPELGSAAAFRRLTGDVVVDLRGRAVKVVLGDEFDDLRLCPDLVPLPRKACATSDVWSPPHDLRDADLAALIDVFPWVLDHLTRLSGASKTNSKPFDAPPKARFRAHVSLKALSRLARSVSRPKSHRKPQYQLALDAEVLDSLQDQLPASLFGLVCQVVETLAADTASPALPRPLRAQVLWSAGRIDATFERLATQYSSKRRQSLLLKRLALLFNELRRRLRGSSPFRNLNEFVGVPWQEILVRSPKNKRIANGPSLARCRLLQNLYCIAEDTQTNQQVLAIIQPVLSAMGILLRGWIVEHHEHLFSVCTKDQRTRWLETHEPGLSVSYLRRTAKTMWTLSTRVFGEGSFSYAALADAMREPDSDRARRAVRRIATVASRHFRNQPIWLSRTHWRWRTTIEMDPSSSPIPNRTADNMEEAMRRRKELDDVLAGLASPFGVIAGQDQGTSK